VFGEYRASDRCRFGGPAGPAANSLKCGMGEVDDWRPTRLLVAKPGLDEPLERAEQIAVAAREPAWKVVYSGIRLTRRNRRLARDEDPV